MSDIVEQLRACEKRLQSIPVDLGSSSATITIAVQLVREAADTIERLRSLAGKADVGQSFSDMTSELRHMPPVND